MDWDAVDRAFDKAACEDQRMILVLTAAQYANPELRAAAEAMAHVVMSAPLPFDDAEEDAN